MPQSVQKQISRRQQQRPRRQSKQALAVLLTLLKRTGETGMVRQKGGQRDRLSSCTSTQKASD
jgi:hypothetical protein